jgi:hypothetical protein
MYSVSRSNKQKELDMNNTVNKHTRAGRDGKKIFCPNCMAVRRVYHFAWSALMCYRCNSEVQKGEFLLAPQALENEIAFETIVVSNMKQLIEELSGAVAYLSDIDMDKISFCGFCNDDGWLLKNSKGLYGSIVRAKNIASCLQLDAKDRRK